VGDEGSYLVALGDDVSLGLLYTAGIDVNASITDVAGDLFLRGDPTASTWPPTAAAARSTLSSPAKPALPPSTSRSAAAEGSKGETTNDAETA